MATSDLTTDTFDVRARRRTPGDGVIGRAHVTDVAAALNRGDVVIDVRIADEYFAGHIPGRDVGVHA